jgi:hypothetical protein
MPNINELRVDKLLGQISVKYKNESYVADEIFPTVPVKLDSDLYRIYARNFRIPESKRADAAESRRHDFHVSTSSYVLEHHALKEYLSDRKAQNYDMADLLRDTTEELTDKIMSRKEKSVSDLFNTSTSWSLNVSLAASWSSATTTTNPLPTVDTAATTVLANSGHMVNYGCFGRQAFVNVKNHPSILDRTKYTTKEMTQEIMKGLFDLPQLLVSTAQVDTSQEGNAEAISALWPDSMFVGYKPPRATPLAPSAGYTFQKSRPLVKRWRSEEREATAVEVNMEYVPKIVSSLSGYLIQGVN